MLNPKHLGILLFAALAAQAPSACAHGNARGTARLVLGRTRVAINYGRPRLNGRNPLELLEPGQLWRLGADVPTTLETDGPVRIGDKVVPKGTYYLLVWRVDSTMWRLIVSTQQFNRYEPSTQVAESPMTLSTSKIPVDEMAISLLKHEGRGTIEIAWGKYRLSCPLNPAG